MLCAVLQVNKVKERIKVLKKKIHTVVAEETADLAIDLLRQAAEWRDHCLQCCKSPRGTKSSTEDSSNRQDSCDSRDSPLSDRTRSNFDIGCTLVSHTLVLWLCGTCFYRSLASKFGSVFSCLGISC